MIIIIIFLLLIISIFLTSLPLCEENMTDIKPNPTQTSVSLASSQNATNLATPDRIGTDALLTSGSDPNDVFKTLDKSFFEQTEKLRKRNNIDFNLFNDLTFRNVLVYDNDPDGRLGLDRCLDNKVGYCIEYGYSGVGYYYPPIYDNLSFGDAITSELTEKEVLQPVTGSMEFPGLR